MKLSKYIEELQYILDTEGDDLFLVYSKDDEGNEFSRVHYKPTLGYFDQGEFISQDDEDYSETANSICIN